MLVRETEGYWVMCDECSDVHDLGARNLEDAVEEVKSAGWLITRNSQQSCWNHFCPACDVGAWKWP